MSSGDKITVGIIGAGRIGKLHAENLTTRILNARVAVIADVILSAAQESAARYDIPKAIEDYHEILQDSTIDAVVICSATHTHAQIIQEAAQAGKHIFCEKPIALDLKAIQQALAAVEKAGVKLQVGFNRRFDANFLKVKELVSTGAIGAPHLLRITSRDPAPPPLDYLKVSGGIFLDMTIHDFDMARYLLDSEVEEIYATGNVLIDNRFKQANDIDTAMVTLKFTNGAMGTIDNSRQAVYGYDQRVEVFGSKGAVWVGNRRPDDHCLLTEQSVSLSRPLYFFVERYRESYVTEMQAFIDAILNNTEPPVTGLDGLIPVKLGYAAKKSFAENRPVRISEIE